MAKLILIEEFHIAVFVPRGRSPADYDAIRRTLDAKPFRGRLRRAIRAVVRAFPSLRSARLRLGR